MDGSAFQIRCVRIPVQVYLIQWICSQIIGEVKFFYELNYIMAIDARAPPWNNVMIVNGKSLKEMKSIHLTRTLLPPPKKHYCFGTCRQPIDIFVYRYDFIKDMPFIPALRHAVLNSSSQKISAVFCGTRKMCTSLSILCLNDSFELCKA